MSLAVLVLCCAMRNDTENDTTEFETSAQFYSLVALTGLLVSNRSSHAVFFSYVIFDIN